MSVSCDCWRGMNGWNRWISGTAIIHPEHDALCVYVWHSNYCETKRPRCAINRVEAKGPPRTRAHGKQQRTRKKGEQTRGSQHTVTNPRHISLSTDTCWFGRSEPGGPGWCVGQTNRVLNIYCHFPFFRASAGFGPECCRFSRSPPFEKLSPCGDPFPRAFPPFVPKSLRTVMMR